MPRRSSSSTPARLPFVCLPMRAKTRGSSRCTRRPRNIAAPLPSATEQCGGGASAPSPATASASSRRSERRRALDPTAHPEPVEGRAVPQKKTAGPDVSEPAATNSANGVGTSDLSRALLGGVGLGGLLQRAGAAEGARQAFVTLVARHLENLVLGGPENHRRGPRLAVHRRVDDFHVPLNRLRTSAREALDRVQVRGGLVLEARLRRVVRAVHDERVAFPVAARVAEPLTDALIDVRTPVERHHANVVDHLLADRDVVLRLENLEVA